MPTEFLHPETHGLVRYDDPARRQQIFDHAQAERKTKIEPHGVGNHFSWEPMAAIKAITSDVGHDERSHRSIADRLTLRCPQGSSIIIARSTVVTFQRFGLNRRNLGHSIFAGLGADVQERDSGQTHCLFPA